MELVGLAPEDPNDQIELISVDIDGNDGYLVEDFLINGVMPSVYIVEINEVFPPSDRFQAELFKRSYLGSFSKLWVVAAGVY